MYLRFRYKSLQNQIIRNVAIIKKEGTVHLINANLELCILIYAATLFLFNQLDMKKKYSLHFK